MNTAKTLDYVESLSAEPFEQLVLQRRATPHFTDEPVPEETLTWILENAGRAPSGYNLQPWRFLILRDAVNRAKLREAAMDQAKITEAPVVVVAYAPHHEWREWMKEVFDESARRGALPKEGQEDRMRTATAFVNSLPLAAWLNRHVMIAFTHMMLAAEAQGYDTAPMEGFDSKKVKTVCGLPVDSEVVALLAIGRAREPQKPFPGRFSLERIAFAENLQTPWPGPRKK